MYAHVYSHMYTYMCENMKCKTIFIRKLVRKDKMNLWLEKKEVKERESQSILGIKTQ